MQFERKWGIALAVAIFVVAVLAILFGSVFMALAYGTRLTVGLGVLSVLILLGAASIAESDES